MNYTKIGFHNNELLLLKNTIKNFPGESYDISEESNSPITKKTSILLIPYSLSNIIINNRNYYIYLWNLGLNFESNLMGITNSIIVKRHFKLNYLKLFFTEEFKELIEKLGDMPFYTPIKLINKGNTINLELPINKAS